MDVGKGQSQSSNEAVDSSQTAYGSTAILVLAQAFRAFGIVPPKLGVV